MAVDAPLRIREAVKHLEIGSRIHGIGKTTLVIVSHRKGRRETAAEAVDVQALALRLVKVVLKDASHQKRAATGAVTRKTMTVLARHPVIGTRKRIDLDLRGLAILIVESVDRLTAMPSLRGATAEEAAEAAPVTKEVSGMILTTARPEQSYKSKRLVLDS